MEEIWKLGDPNKSGNYILPMLGLRLSEFKREGYANLPQSRFVNCFIGDDDKEHYNNHIFVCYKYSGDQGFLKFENSMQQNVYYVGSYDPDIKHVMHVYSVPKHWQEDYDFFKEGKYSRFSKIYKRHIQEFHSFTDDHPVMQTLNKSEERFKRLEAKFDIEIPRDQECSSIPDLNIEIYQDKYKVKTAIQKSKDFE